jgi:hypothetical protein
MIPIPLFRLVAVDIGRHRQLSPQEGMMRAITVAASERRWPAPLLALALSPDCRESAEILNVCRQNSVQCIAPDRSDFKPGSTPSSTQMVSGGGLAQVTSADAALRVLVDLFKISSSATPSIRS